MYDRITELALKGTPFLFYTDFKGERVHVYTLDELDAHDIEFALHDPNPEHSHAKHITAISPVDFDSYKQKFDIIIEEIKKGDTYLLNLTQPTKLMTTHTLKSIYDTASAPYKLRVADQFTCFSPERFIKITNNKIYTYPMKGTIDASIPNAEAKILANTKEMAEHIMIVDLLRNDLGMVARDIKVERFRYIDKIVAGDRKLLQVSSEITGRLEDNWQSRLGDIIATLLPAGSISGTPKRSTVQIIEDVEKYDRGYFTGIFGIFDGQSLDTGVMIRYVENIDGTLIYKSGGGITLDSDPTAEYQEMIDKVYLN
jgi:para-aminobenzoate synthetase component 1